MLRELVFVLGGGGAEFVLGELELVLEQKIALRASMFRVTAWPPDLCLAALCCAWSLDFALTFDCSRRARAYFCVCCVPG